MTLHQEPLKAKALFVRQGIAKSNKEIKDGAPWKTGFAWKNGKHYTFDKEQITVTQGWPGLRVWTRGIDSSWKGSRFTGIASWLCDTEYIEENVSVLQEKIQLTRQGIKKPLTIQEFAELKRNHALLELQKTIPADVLMRTRQFSYRRWHLLCLQARVPGAADLIDSNPALGWMLANHWIFRNGVGKSDATRVAQRWVGKPQQEILQWLGFDGSKSTRQIISRIDPFIADASPLLYLRKGLLDGEVKKAMQHQQTFSADSLRIVTDPILTRRVTPNFLQKLSEDTARSLGTFYSSRLKEALFLESEYKHKIPKRFQSTKQFNALSQFPLPNDLLYQPLYSEEHIQETPFPVAPWPGVPGIEPLTNYIALQEEGKAMQHCVGAYASIVLQGNCYIYKVTYPMRATLEARRVNNHWVLGEISGKRNASIESYRAIAVWQKLTGRGLI